MTTSPLLQILLIYIATSLAAGLTLGVPLGTMIRRAERRHRQHVAQLMQSRTCKPLAGRPSPYVHRSSADAAPGQRRAAAGERPAVPRGEVTDR
jgi:hypothetical protein